MRASAVPTANLIQDRYRPLKKLGRASLGETFLVQDVQLERPLILETLLGPPMIEGGRIPSRAAARLRDDLQALASLRDPHLFTLVDLQLQARPPFLAYEPVAGEPLPRWVSQGPPRGAALEEALDDAARQVLGALKTLHGAGVVHKDLRPATVLRKPTGDLVVMEPGLLPDESLIPQLQAGWREGLELFMAPEVLRGAEPNEASDLYQLGGLLRFMATGRPPFASADEARQAAAQGAALPAMAQAAPGLREAWCQLIDELQSPDLGTRIGSVAAAEEFLDLMLLEEAEQEGLIAAPPAPPGPTGPTRSRATVLVPAALLAVGVLFGASQLAGGGAQAGLQGTFVEGVDKLVAAWKPTGDGAPSGPVQLIVGEGAPRELKADGGGFSASLARKDVAGKVYRVTDAAGNLLASGTFPEGAAPLRCELAALWPEDGSLDGVQVLATTNYPVVLEASFQRLTGAEGKAAGEGKASSGSSPRPSPTADLPLKADESYERVRWEAVDAAGDRHPVEGPTRLEGSAAFLRRIATRVRALIPKPVTQKLRDAVRATTDQFVPLDLPEWAALRERWATDPDFVRLRRQGPALMGAKDLDKGLRGNLYDALNSLDRANCVVVALAGQDPLELRPIQDPWARALNPPDIQGTLAVSSGQGAMMMQFSNPPKSFINEDGKKRWPERFEAPYELPEELAKPGKRVRFTVAVDDISPLYRMELRIVFPQPQDDSGGDEDDGGLFGSFSSDPSIAYWFYPRRSFPDILEERAARKGAAADDPLAATHKMALEVPSEAFTQRNVRLELRIDKLGIWGGHGATTFYGLFVGPGGD